AITFGSARARLKRLSAAARPSGAVEMKPAGALRNSTRLPAKPGAPPAGSGTSVIAGTRRDSSVSSRAVYVRRRRGAWRAARVSDRSAVTPLRILRKLLRNMVPSLSTREKEMNETTREANRLFGRGRSGSEDHGAWTER